MSQEEFYSVVVDNMQNEYVLLVVIGVAVCCCFVYMVFRDMFNRK